MKTFKKLARRFSAAVPASLAGGRRAPAGARAVASQVQATIQQALAQAGLGTGNPGAAGIRKTIDEALARSGLSPRSTDPGLRTPAPAPRPVRMPPMPPLAPPPVRADRPAASDLPGTGTSTIVTFRHESGTRSYVLYVPPGLDAATPGDGAPLMVMLHGCTQSPDDFAAGTRMNALADRHGVLVAYPAQTPRDNGSRCWNWFRPEDQQRGSGEPAILAGIVEDIAQRQRVDRRRVYVAGLSAGAAMAVILGRTYPDVFAAIGAHSGLPFGAAQDVPGAFAAMQGRGKARAATPGATGTPRVPTIVLHGTADRTVQSDNGRAIVDDAVAADVARAPLQAATPERLTVNGRDAIRTGYRDGSGRIAVEHVVIEGAGHTWSGGDPSGSHTDPAGPDASDLILQFCLRHAR